MSVMTFPSPSHPAPSQWGEGSEEARQGTREIHALCPHVKIVFMSAYGIETVGAYRLACG